jgi:hypothetical protein
LIARRPLSPEYRHHDGILTPTVHEVALAEMSFAAEAEAVEQLERSLVPRINVGFDPMQAKLSEGETDHRRNRL